MHIRVLFIVFVIQIISCQDKEPVQQEILRPVKYQQVGAMPEGLEKAFTGLAKAGTESNISFKISGTLTKLAVKVGTAVRRGQLIALVDDSDYELKFEEADAAVKNADAQEKNAKSNFERISLLYENQNASLSEYESARAAFNSAKANEKAAKQRRKLANSQLGYTRLFAPFSGIVSEKYVDENENVSAGQPIVLLASEDDLEVKVSIPDVFISGIQEGIEVHVEFSAFKDRIFHGLVSEVAYASGFQTTYPVTIKLEESSDDLRPGMTAEVRFPVKNENLETILVPSHSVAEDEKGNYVYTFDVDSSDVGIVRRIPVEVGELTQRGLEVTAGLSGGEKIITAGVSKITEGMKVKINL